VHELQLVQTELTRQVQIRENEYRDLQAELFRVQEERDAFAHELLERDVVTQSVGVALESLGEDLTESLNLSTTFLSDQDDFHSMTQSIDSPNVCY
jgi:hypothetical protein